MCIEILCNIPSSIGRLQTETNYFQFPCDIAPMGKLLLDTKFKRSLKVARAASRPKIRRLLDGGITHFRRPQRKNLFNLVHNSAILTLFQ